jgi:transcriptional regulator with XRE-family HTH domain
MVDDHRSEVSGRLARNLRRLRIAHHLSLSELARATGTSKATLSSIESGGANPTVDTLAALAGALRVPLAELLEPLPVPELRVVRAGNRSGAERRLDTGRGGPEISELTLGERELRERDPATAGTWAHLYVLQGGVVAGPVERVTELTRGDYAEFPADVPHQIETTGTTARVLLVLLGRPL